MSKDLNFTRYPTVPIVQIAPTVVTTFVAALASIAATVLLNLGSVGTALNLESRGSRTLSEIKYNRGVKRRQLSLPSHCLVLQVSRLSL